MTTTTTNIERKAVMVRQGDVLLIPAGKLPAKTKDATDAKGRIAGGITIAGERTGHAHTLTGRVQLDARGRTYINVPSPGRVLQHQEHENLYVPGGLYEVRIQREHVPLSRPGQRYD